jgi:hypothetical protein
MTSKVAAAQDATEAVQEYVRRALDVLQGEARSINAEGVLLRPVDYRAVLRAAAGQLNAAAVLIERTQWPSRNDYEGA